MRIGLGGLWLLALVVASGPAAAGGTKCSPDSVLVGATCVDTYEASVWVLPPALWSKARGGKLTLAALEAAGATQVGTASDDYPAFCPDTGNGCRNQMFALSIPGVLPARFITWFQAVQACTNSGKRLITNQEWSAAASGTSDGPPCVVNAAAPGPTGTPACISEWGVADMVGNVSELTADWHPLNENCFLAPFPATGDEACIGGASLIVQGPIALHRGGYFSQGPGAGVFTAWANAAVGAESSIIGFRCAR